MVTRADLFLQTKFTYRGGQDHRLPHDPAADLSMQVAESMARSLEHLGTDQVDSYVLHGPASGHGGTDDDAEVWAAMARERDASRTRLLGRAWFVHHLAFALMVFLHPRVPAIDYRVPKETLVEHAVWFSLRGLGLSDDAIRRHYNPKALSLLAR